VKAADEERAEFGVEPVVAADGTGKVPGVDQDVLAEEPDQGCRFDPGGRIVADGRDLYRPIEESRPVEERVEGRVREAPPLLRVPLGTLGLRSHRSQEQDVVETDDVLDDGPGIPVRAW
jgi:hypothetical protein